MTIANVPGPAPATAPEAMIQKARETTGSIAAFSSQNAFEAAQRMAKALASSSLVPVSYQNNIPNVLIAMELASRIGASVFSIMQNIDIIHGRPSWRATFLIATVNACGRFTPIRFRFEGTEGTESWGCRAVAKDRESGEECVGALITLGMAKREGWSTKRDSKWVTMPEQMIMYRAAAFWTRVYAPELSLGMHTNEEVIDTYGYAAPEVTVAAPATKALEAALLGVVPPAPASEPKAPPAPESGPEVREQPKLVGEQPLVDPPAKAKKAKAEKPQPIQDIDPETGEIVPPPGAGDAWEPEAPR